MLKYEFYIMNIIIWYGLECGEGNKREGFNYKILF